jgi:hypothetical protein
MSRPSSVAGSGDGSEPSFCTAAVEGVAEAATSGETVSGTSATGSNAIASNTDLRWTDSTAIPLDCIGDVGRFNVGMFRPGSVVGSGDSSESSFCTAVDVTSEMVGWGAIAEAAEISAFD